MPNTNVVIGQGWIALKLEYCIRERQLVRSQNRLSYERGWAERGGRRESASTRQERGGHGGWWRKWLQGTHRPVAVGRKGSSKPFRHYLPFLTCLKECVRAPEWDMPVLREVRGRRWGSPHHPAVEGPTAAFRHLASHWSLISAGGEEERGVSFSKPQKYYTSPFIVLSTSSFCPSSFCCFSPLPPRVSLALNIPSLTLYSHLWHCTSFLMGGGGLRAQLCDSILALKDKLRTSTDSEAAVCSKPVCKALTAIRRKAASFPAWALSAPTGCMLCQSKASGWGAVRHEHWCHSHMDSGVVMLGGWEAELCWPAAAETAVQGFALVIVVLLWTRSLMMYFVISAMKGKSVCMLILHYE